MDGRLSTPAAGRLRVTFRIAIPAGVSAAAAPIVSVTIVARPRAGEPAVIVSRRHRPAVIAVIAAGRDGKAH